MNVLRIDEWRQQLEVSTKTEHNIVTLLISLMRLARDELQWIDTCPLIKKPKLTEDGTSYRFFQTRKDIDTFLRAAQEYAELNYALYSTAVWTGMRAGEIAGLEKPDVDLDRRLITVRRSFDNPTKSGWIRHVPILDPLLPVLRAWFLKNPLSLVFPNAAGQMFQPSARIFQEQLHEVLDAAGFKPIKLGDRTVPYVTFHCLRHTWASHWMMSGGSIFKLQRIGGWRSFAMVQRYAHLAPDAFAEDYARLGAPLASGTGAILKFVRSDE